MRAGGDRGRRSGVLAVGLAAAAFGFVAFAATGGPVPLATGGPDPATPPAPDESLTPLPVDRAEELLPRLHDNTAGVDVASVMVQVVSVVVAAILMVLIVRAVARIVSAGVPDEVPVLGADLAAPSGHPRELGEAVDDGLAALASGPVDDVIIACWVRLEAAAAAGGAERRPSETSAELAVRMLARFDVPDEPVAELLALYRAARYSRHHLDEDDRRTAITALGEIRAAMAVPT